MSKYTLTRVRDIPGCETGGRDNYQTGKHRMVVYEHLPLQAGIHFINRLPDSIKYAPTPKVLIICLKRLTSKTIFYNVAKFLADNWETTIITLVLEVETFGVLKGPCASLTLILCPQNPRLFQKPIRFEGSCSLISSGLRRYAPRYLFRVWQDNLTKCSLLIPPLLHRVYIR
ncbi:hypothetical protein J6590_047373 [Homalodisca vitripennis]|nr:hypothetical protein J6590_047373 [Homalodisca vitripennis]